MKITQTQKTATAMIAKYGKGDMDGFISEAKKITEGDDIYVRIDRNNETIYPSGTSLLYDAEIMAAKNKLTLLKSKDGTESYTETLLDLNNEKRTYIFAGYLDHTDSSVLYIVTPLYPVTSTIKILKSQLVYIMIIALALAFILSFYLSSKISRPIISITRSARRLADGQYGTTFPTHGQYSEITNLSEALNKTSYELEKSVLLQKDLMANVSHDLRTPLTMIKSYAEMIRDLSGNIPEKRDAHLQVIIEEADRLNVLVGDMLTLSAMQSGTMSLSAGSFNLKDAIKSVLLPYALLEEQEGFSIRFNCKHDVYVDGDVERIKQVISNLLTNAVKYCGTDKQVIINVKRWGRKVHCEVVDHGVGIKPEELSHIWDRYYKTSSNHVRETSGSGLGLSIVKEILTLHGAKFGAESKVGKGTTVWFELSLSKPLNAPNRL
ncbi:MAG: HAMP domain-containing sensor histidine kinase [Anaerovoracaceae bacterium]